MNSRSYEKAANSRRQLPHATLILHVEKTVAGAIVFSCACELVPCVQKTKLRAALRFP